RLHAERGHAATAPPSTVMNSRVGALEGSRTREPSVAIRICLYIDGPRWHRHALAKHDNAHVTVVTVTEPWAPLDMAHEARQHRPDPIGHFEEMATAAANRILDGAAQRGNAHGVTCDVVHVKDQHPAEGIVATAKEKGCDLIVMASHGRRGLSRLLL